MYLRAFLAHFGTVLYFTSSKSHFFSLTIYFYKTPHISFSILQYIILKYYTIILSFLYMFFSTLQSYRTATKPTPNHNTSRRRLAIIRCSNNHQPSTPANHNPPTTNNLPDPNRNKTPKTNHHPYATVKTDEFLTDRPPQEPPSPQTHVDKSKPTTTTTIPANPPEPKTHSRYNHPKTQNPDHNPQEPSPPPPIWVERVVERERERAE